MKKIIITLLFIAGTFGFINVNAQTKPAAKKTAPMAKMAAKGKDSAMAKKSGMKKDGTPDMRLKENKAAAKTAPAATTGPLKKDGTPDMRYKANKKKS